MKIGIELLLLKKKASRGRSRSDQPKLQVRNFDAIRVAPKPVNRPINIITLTDGKKSWQILGRGCTIGDQ
jgi:hypothetical protein